MLPISLPLDTAAEFPGVADFYLGIQFWAFVRALGMLGFNACAPSCTTGPGCSLPHSNAAALLKDPYADTMCWATCSSAMPGLLLPTFSFVSALANICLQQNATLSKAAAWVTTACTAQTLGMAAGSFHFIHMMPQVSCMTTGLLIPSLGDGSSQHPMLSP